VTERIPVLYLAPWVDYGGSDTNTLDWFRWINRSRFSASLMTTQPSSNRRLSGIVPYASEIWALPELIFTQPADRNAQHVTQELCRGVLVLGPDDEVVERCHDRNALYAQHLTVRLDLTHLRVEILDRIQQIGLLVFLAGDLEGAVQDGDFDRPSILHSSSSGSLVNSASRRVRAEAIFSLSCLFALCAAASCCRNSWLSVRRR